MDNKICQKHFELSVVKRTEDLSLRDISKLSKLYNVPLREILTIKRLLQSDKNLKKKYSTFYERTPPTQANEDSAFRNNNCVRNSYEF